MELGLLLLRIVVGGLFIGHGTQKLFGWFGGPGLEGASSMFGSLGYRQPRRMAALGGSAEAGGGALLALGLLTPLAAAAIIGVMLNAIVTAHAPNGLWVDNGGYEYNIVLATAAAAITFIGPGAWSLGAAIGASLTGIVWGLTAVLLGLAVGAGTLATRAASPAASEAEPAEEERRAA